MIIKKLFYLFPLLALSCEGQEEDVDNRQIFPHPRPAKEEKVPLTPVKLDPKEEKVHPPVKPDPVETTEISGNKMISEIVEKNWPKFCVKLEEFVRAYGMENRLEAMLIEFKKRRDVFIEKLSDLNCFKLLSSFAPKNHYESWWSWLVFDLILNESMDWENGVIKRFNDLCARKKIIEYVGSSCRGRLSFVPTSFEDIGKFGDWNDIIAPYNLGNARVCRILDEVCGCCNSVSFVLLNSTGREIVKGIANFEYREHGLDIMVWDSNCQDQQDKDDLGDFFCNILSTRKFSIIKVQCSTKMRIQGEGKELDKFFRKKISEFPAYTLQNPGVGGGWRFESPPPLF
ncbi:MAG: hypothetical protein LBD32_00730 [Cytophagales bacterium]|jgi:hypothetical protein|nr:hypothetical protein [Cytophagales bacterium]